MIGWIRLSWRGRLYQMGRGRHMRMVFAGTGSDVTKNDCADRLDDFIVWPATQQDPLGTTPTFGMELWISSRRKLSDTLQFASSSRLTEIRSDPWGGMIFDRRPQHVVHPVGVKHEGGVGNVKLPCRLSHKKMVYLNRQFWWTRNISTLRTECWKREVTRFVPHSNKNQLNPINSISSHLLKQIFA